MNYKSGLKSSELYTSLVAQIFGFLVVMGFFTPEQASELQDLSTSIIGGVIALVALVAYIRSRTSYKETVMVTEAISNLRNSPEGSLSSPITEELGKELEKAILG